MTEKEKAAFEVVDKICAGFQGNRKEHVVIQASLKIIYDGLNPPPSVGKKVEVPKKALPRNRKKKTKNKR